MRHVAGFFVCFTSSFRQDGSRGGTESPNISHAVLDGSDKTLCGRRGWMTKEGMLSKKLSDDTEYFHDPDCIRCANSLARLRDDRETCSGCHQKIDRCWCWCGSEYAAHSELTGHPFIPMGCDCYRSG